MGSSDGTTRTPPLAPRLEGDLAAVLTETGLLHELVAALGSPLNVVLPDRLADNVAAFRTVYRRHHLAGRIWYAHKANRSSALVRAAAATEAGVDVASAGELQHAAGAGFAPDRIIATGPKSREFLWLAARLGVLVSVDSADELRELAAVVAVHRLPRVRVLARLSGFAGPGARVLARRSRFGVPAGALGALLDLVAAHAGAVELAGVAYHLDTVGLPEKAVALDGCIAAMDECHRRGLTPRVIDIGGGFGVNYLADGAQWDRWTTALAGAVLGTEPPLTWDGHGYGWRNEGGTLRGALGVYPAYRPVAGAAYLDRLLATASPALHRPLGTVLLDAMYDLHVEPGRALLDQCGAVLGTVAEVRDDPDGYLLVRLDLNASDVSTEEHGVLMDPVLIPRPGPEPDGGPAGVHLLGNLCLEADLITRRRVFLPRRPRPGDLLAFPNTAGYFMDFSAHHAIRQPVASTVALYRDGGHRRWCLDDRYWPVAGSRAAA